MSESDDLARSWIGTSTRAFGRLVIVESMEETRDLIRGIEALAAETPDHHAFREAADPLLRTTIGYDVAAWASIDPATLLFTSCDVLTPAGPGGNSPERERALFASEFKGEDPLTFTKILQTGQTVTRLRAQVPDVSTVERYRNLMEPAGVVDEMRVMATDRWGVWGAIILYRSQQWGTFDSDSQAKAETVAGKLASAFRHAFLRSSIGAATIPRPPGSLTLDRKGGLATTSGPAERWLDTLTSSQVSGALHALRHGVEEEGTTRILVSGQDGPVMFHAHRRKGSDDEVSVIVERPRPVEIADVIMSAHGLTPREEAVTRELCRGRTNRQISADLEISPYTVEDHLKSVYSKFGVASRHELLHLLYSRYYQPQRAQDQTPGPYGYFLSE